MITSIVDFLVGLYARKVDRLERRVGYRLSFPHIPPAWINSLVRIDLTSAWKKFGLDVSGVDYFTLGAIVGGVSSRFDPAAKQYQSWLGGYLVRFEETREWSLQDHLHLAVVDQTDWLIDYGDPAPLCELPQSNFKEIAQVVVSGYPARIYEGVGYSHSEVGPGNRSASLWRLMLALAAMLNRYNPALRLSARNFIPQGPGLYDRVYLKGYIVDVEVEKDVRCVLYGNGAIYKNKDGKEVDTFLMLKEEMLGTLKAAVITKAAS